MRWSTILLSTALGVALVNSCLATDGEETVASMKDCSFNAAPEEFLSAQSRIRTDIADRLQKIGSARFSATSARNTVAASSVSRRNFIDEQIFGKMSQANA